MTHKFSIWSLFVSELKDATLSFTPPPFTKKIKGDLMLRDPCLKQCLTGMKCRFVFIAFIYFLFMASIIGFASYGSNMKFIF